MTKRARKIRNPGRRTLDAMRAMVRTATNSRNLEPLARHVRYVYRNVV